jgi:hypothetical protein
MRAGAFMLLGVAAGFAVGFLWGQATRERVSSNTETNYANGVITVRVNAGKALREGLNSAGEKLLSYL